jgi:hypothetical protein
MSVLDGSVGGGDESRHSFLSLLPLPSLLELPQGAAAFPLTFAPGAAAVSAGAGAGAGASAAAGGSVAGEEGNLDGTARARLTPVSAHADAAPAPSSLGRTSPPPSAAAAVQTRTSPAAAARAGDGVSATSGGAAGARAWALPSAAVSPMTGAQPLHVWPPSPSSPA